MDQRKNKNRNYKLFPREQNENTSIINSWDIAEVISTALICIILKGSLKTKVPYTHYKKLKHPQDKPDYINIKPEIYKI